MVLKDRPRFHLAIGLVALVLSCASADSHLRIDTYPDKASALAARSILRPTARRLLSDDPDTVCYEGCFVPPINDMFAKPLPVLLYGDPSVGPIVLEQCYQAAKSANLSVFGVYDIFYCYGGDAVPAGWAVDTCPLDCAPNGLSPFTCGGVLKASVFSMGKCLQLDTPCQPEERPPLPPLPPSPSPPPLPPSPAPPSPSLPTVPQVPTIDSPPEDPGFPTPPPPRRSPPPSPLGKFECKPEVALLGTNVTSVKLPSKNTNDFNNILCRERCYYDQKCQGYFYKKTGWCNLVAHVTSFNTKHYATAYYACIKL